MTFEIHAGEAVGVVGESGSGKTLTSLSILGLLPRGVAVTAGSVNYNGMNSPQLRLNRYENCGALRYRWSIRIQ